MSEVEFNEYQKKVITNPISDMLVSAAAGSGKSTVLVERIIRHILSDSPIGIDEMLIVTFTKAAASSLREKINEKLTERIESPDTSEAVKRKLRAELSKLPSADISTIDSFCNKVLKSYFFVVDIDPNYRIIDAGEAKVLLTEAMNKVFDNEYEGMDSEFKYLVDSYATPKSDEAVRNIIELTIKQLSSQAFPEKFLENMGDSYNISCAEDIDNSEIFKAVYDEYYSLISDAYNSFRETMEDVGDGEDIKKFYDMLDVDCKKLEKLLNANTFSELADACAELSFDKQASTTKTTDIVKKDKVVKIRNYYKKAITDKKSAFFLLTKDNIVEEFNVLNRAVKEIIKLTKLVYDEYFELKKKANAYEFSDISQMALRILLDKDKDNKPSEYAKEVKAKYKEIMIDEYQDSNTIQELLLESISGRFDAGNNIFMVGDVKQSIYKFRQAEPEIFMTKYNDYRKNDNEKEVIVDLKQNYRSAKPVIDTVNKIFRKIMERTISGIDYDEYAELNQGTKYEDYDDDPIGRTEVNLYIPHNLEKDDAEYQLVAKRIMELLASGFPVKTKEGMRPIEPGDICVLYSSVDYSSAADLCNTLRDQGIGAFVNSKRGFFKTLEVNQVLNYLRIIDNPYQDIELISVLRSFIGGLSNEELALLKIYGNTHLEKDCYIFDIVEAVINDESEAHSPLTTKIVEFYSDYKRLKKLSQYTVVRDVVQALYDITNYYNYVYALPAGDTRVGNLNMLLSIATDFEKTEENTVGAFVRYIDNLIKHEQDTGEALLEDNSNVVHIMTIHGSKGLEYPVVILTGAEKEFSKKKRPSTLFHSKYGIGLKRKDPNKNLKMDSLVYNYIKAKLKDEDLGERIRVLYVALTRAKQKLIVYGKGKNTYEKTLDMLEEIEYSDNPLKVSDITSIDSFLDMILKTLYGDSEIIFNTIMAAVKDDEFYTKVVSNAAEVSAWVEQFEGNEAEDGESKSDDEDGDVQVVVEEPDRVLKDEKLVTKLNDLSPEELDKLINDYFSFTYEFEESDAPQKFSVSELKHDYMDHIDEKQAGENLEKESKADAPRTPLFMGGKAEDTPNFGAMRGTAYHLFMQHVILTDYTACAELMKYAREKVEDGLFSEDIFKLVNFKDIETFLSSDLAKRMRAARDRGELYLEQPFVLGLPAREIDKKYKSEALSLIQGEIDVFFIEDGEAVLLDYKTDKIKTPDGSELAEYYKKQLELYKLAIEKIKKISVKESIIYSFSANNLLYL